MPPPRVGTAVPLDTSVRQITRLISWVPTAPLLPTTLKVDHASVSSNSRHSMTPFEMGLGGSFSIPSYAGMHHSSITPVTSVAGLQQVTSSRWHQSTMFSPLTPQVTDTLSTEQATKVYQLTAECQALGSKLAKQFQTLSSLEAMHYAVAQATAHETVLLGCVAHSATYGVATTIQNAEKWESILCGLHA